MAASAPGWLRIFSSRPNFTWLDLATAPCAVAWPSHLGVVPVSACGADDADATCATAVIASIVAPEVTPTISRRDIDRVVLMDYHASNKMDGSGLRSRHGRADSPGQTTPCSANGQAPGRFPSSLPGNVSVGARVTTYSDGVAPSGGRTERGNSGVRAGRLH